MKTTRIRQVLQLFAGIAATLVISASAQAVTTVETELQKLLANDGASGDRFGNSVALDGNVALVGTPLDDDNGSGSGSAYVFRWDGSSWVQEAKLTPSDGAPLDLFGNSVAIDGDTAVVGASGDDDNGSGSGSAYVFRWDGSSWVQEAKLTPDDGAAFDQFGRSSALSGNSILVGAFEDNDNGPISGSAYVFRWNGSSWVQEAKLTPDDGAAFDQFGFSVAMDGDTALIGAHEDDDNGARSGSAYVFHWNGSSWIQEAKLTPNDGTTWDRFGWSLALDAGSALIGAFDDDDNGNSSGSAYVFRWDGSAWAQEAKLLPSDGAAQDLFGFSVALYGDNAAIGAYGDADNGSASGSAYVFTRSGSNWSESVKLQASDGSAMDRLGYYHRGVDISGTNVIAGASFEDAQGSDAGAAYIFGLTNIQTNTPPVANAGPDQTVEATANPDSPVTLDGTGSYDDDGDALTYSWTNTSVSTSGVTPTVDLWLGVHTITLEVSDGTDTATDDVVITVQDTTPPVITPPDEVTAFATGALTTVDIGIATATDLFEPIAINSDAPAQFPVGPTTVTWTATDANGNSATAEQQVTVQYDWAGFYEPVENLPTLNTVKGGRTVPIKWSVPIPGGGYIRDTSIVTGVQFASVACDDSTAYENPVEAETSGNSGLSYDMDAEQFVYRWKTSKDMAGTCALFILTLNDGSEHYAKFKVK